MIPSPNPPPRPDLGDDGNAHGLDLPTNAEIDAALDADMLARLLPAEQYAKLKDSGRQLLLAHALSGDGSLLIAHVEYLIACGYMAGYSARGREYRAEREGRG